MIIEGLIVYDMQLFKFGHKRGTFDENQRHKHNKLQEKVKNESWNNWMSKQ